MNRFLIIGIFVLSALSFSATTTSNSMSPVKNTENKNIESSNVTVPETKKIAEEKKAVKDDKCVVVTKNEECPAIKEIINKKPPVSSEENPEIKEDYKD